MSRIRLRLFSCFCLATYLFANTHVNLAADALLCAGRPGHFATSPISESDEHMNPACDHCHSKHDHSAPTTPGPSGSASKDSCQDCRDVPCEPGCPDCPDGPAKHSCPCPGGCAMCNVAKAPCLDALTVLAPASVCLGASSLEEPFFHVPPFCDGLIRPPRLAV